MPGQSARAEEAVGQAPGTLATLQAFVNTRDIEQATEELDSPWALASWLQAAGLLEPAAPAAPAGASSPAGASAAATPADLEMALELREALRGVLRGHVPTGAHVPAGPDGTNPPEAAATALPGLRRISASLPTRLDVTADGRVGLAAAGSGVPAALARILLIAADSATLRTWSRLKVCSAQDCQWAFYDRSPTRSGCWCTMRLCGSRAKARAYRQRAAATRPGGRPTASRSARTSAPGA